MRTAVDSSVLLDVFGADPTFGEASRRELRAAYDRGALLACDVVWAEVTSAIGSPEEARTALFELGVRFDALGSKASETAGFLWRHRPRTGTARRARVVADFLIGAHALEQADALLTRDRGFFRESFANLKILDPSQEP